MRIALCCTVATLFVAVAAARANDRDSAERMLTACEQTVGGVKSFHIECIAKQWDNEALQGNLDKLAGAYSSVEETAIFHDGLRWRIAMVQRRTPKPGDRVQFAPLSGVEYRFDEFPGGRQGLHVQWASLNSDEPPKLDNLSVHLMGAGRGDEHARYLDWSDVPFGLMPCDARQPLWQVMREAEALELLPDAKSLDGHKIHVLTSKGKFGTHTVCLDPDFGFLPRQIVIHKGDGDLFNAVQLGVEQDPTARIPERARARLRDRGMLAQNYTITESETRIESVQLEKRDGKFVMTGFDHVQEQAITRGERTEQVRNKTEYRASVIDFQPDTWPADAFRNAVAIPNGTSVRSSETGQSHVWMNGTLE